MNYKSTTEQWLAITDQCSIGLFVGLKLHFFINNKGYLAVFVGTALPRWHSSPERWWHYDASQLTVKLTYGLAM